MIQEHDGLSFLSWICLDHSSCKSLIQRLLHREDDIVDCRCGYLSFIDERYDYSLNIILCNLTEFQALIDMREEVLLECAKHIKAMISLDASFLRLILKILNSALITMASE